MTQNPGSFRSSGVDDRPADAHPDEAFEGGIDRRTFLSLSAATRAVLALPGAATADVTGSR